MTYTPVYHPASLGGLERQHLDIKNSLKATLHHMGDRYGAAWHSVLPWVLLGKRAAFQPDLGTCPAELVLGQTPLIPGALAGADLNPDTNLDQLLENLRTKAARPAVQTSHHDSPTVHTPRAMDNATHVYTRRGKVTPLGPRFDGPFPITERQGDSCLTVKAGNYVNSTPRFELHHWQNCKIANPDVTTPDASRRTLGRPKNKPGEPDKRAPADSESKQPPLRRSPRRKGI